MSQALAPGVVVYGLVFGVLASQQGMSALQAVLMSAFVYSGSAQLAALQGWGAAASVTALVATVLVMNARYLLYGAAIQPWLAGIPTSRAFASLFVLGDGNWALSMREYQAGYRDAGFVFGSGVAQFLPWVLGTWAGFLLASAIPDPRMWGLDFMLVAFAAAIGVSMWRGKADLLPSVAAVIVAWLLHRFVTGGWYIVGAGIAGGIVAAWRVGKDAPDE